MDSAYSSLVRLYDEGNTPLHLLCAGKFDAILRGRLPGNALQEIRTHLDEKNCHKVAERLLATSPKDAFSENSRHQTPLDVLLASFRKELLNIDFVRLLNVLISHPCVNENPNVRTWKSGVYVPIIQHLCKNEDVADDMKQLLATLQSLDEDAAKHIVAGYFQLAEEANTKEEKPGLIASWLVTSLESMNEDELKLLFRDSDVKKSLEVLLKASRRKVAQSVLRRFCAWHSPHSGNTIAHELVCEGDVKLFSSLLKFDPGEMATGRNFLGQTPLFCCRSVKTLEALPLKQCLYPLHVDKEGYTALTWFAKNGFFQFARKLLRLDPKFDFNYDGSKSVVLTSVQGVASNGSSAEAIEFLKAAAAGATSVNFKDRDGAGRNALMTLFLLMREDNVTECQSFAEFLQRQPEFSTEDVDCEQRNILMHVAHTLSHNQSLVKACTDAFQTLFSKSNMACLNKPDEDNRCLLIYLINELRHCTSQEQRQSLEELACLVVPKSEINAVDSEDRSALMHAVRNDSETIVKCLLDEGADVNMVNESQETAVYFASILQNKALLNLFVKMPVLSLATTNGKGQNVVHQLAALGKEDALRNLLAAREDVDLMSEDQNGDTPVYLAIRSEHCSQTVLKTLIMDARFKMLELNSKGKSVIAILEEAAVLESCPFEEDLARKFSNEMDKTTWNGTYLAMAMKMKGIEHVQDQCGLTAAMYALRQGVQFPMTKLISSESVNLKDNLGQSVIHYMLDFDAHRMLLSLLQMQECDIYNRDSSKQSAMMKATLKAPIEVIKALFQHPLFDVTFIEKEPAKTTLHLFVGKREGETKDAIFNLFIHALEKAVEKSDWDAKVVKMFLLVPGCSIDTVDQRHGTALNYALMTGNMKLALDIIDSSNPNVNHKDTNGNTPLTSVVQRLGGRDVKYWSKHETDLIEAMLAHNNTDVNLSNNAWQTPLSLAIDNQNDGLVKRLLACKTLGLQLPQFQRYSLCEYIVAKRNLDLLRDLLHHSNFDLNASDWNKTGGEEEIHDGTSLLILIVKAPWKDGCATLLKQQHLSFAVEDGDGLMHAIQHLSADDVRRMLEHPNCKLTHTNRFGITAEKRLKELLRLRKDTRENFNIEKMIEARTKSESEFAINEPFPKDDRELRVFLEAKVQAFLEKQRCEALRKEKKEEMQSLIYYFVENIMSVSNPDRESAVDYQRKYEKNYCFLVRELDVNECFLSYLRSADVLSQADGDEIVGDRYRKAQLVLHKLRPAGSRGYTAFMQALRSQKQDHIIEEIERPSSDITASSEEIARRHLQVQDTAIKTTPTAADYETHAMNKETTQDMAQETNQETNQEITEETDQKLVDPPSSLQLTPSSSYVNPMFNMYNVREPEF